MHRSPLSVFCLLVLSTALLTPLCWGQTPAPAANKEFNLPLADGTTGTALILPTSEGQAYLVYTTPTGKLGSYLMKTGTTPNPVDPPPTPTPTPTRLTIAIVEDPATTTAQQRAILAAPAWRGLANEQHAFLGIIPNDLKEAKTGQPPALLAPFLNRSKGHALPWVMLYDSAGNLFWEGPLPTTAQAMTALLTPGVR